MKIQNLAAGAALTVVLSTSQVQACPVHGVANALKSAAGVTVRATKAVARATRKAVMLPVRVVEGTVLGAYGGVMYWAVEGQNGWN